MVERTPSPNVELFHLSDRASFREETYENAQDKFIFSLPLCRGRAHIFCDGGTLYDGDVRPGMVRVLSPGERFHEVRRSTAEAAILTLDGGWFRRVVNEFEYCPRPTSLAYIEPILRPNQHIERLAFVLGSTPKIDPNLRVLFLEGVTQALLAIVLSPQEQAGANPPARGALSDEQFARCIDYADANIADRVDLTCWAAELGMAPGEFTRRFRCRMQTSPYAWLLNWRVDRAKHLLAREGLSLADVALTVGFSSQSHFTDAFRRRVGLPPGRWRSQVRTQRTCVTSADAMRDTPDRREGLKAEFPGS